MKVFKLANILNKDSYPAFCGFVRDSGLIGGKNRIEPRGCLKAGLVILRVCNTCLAKPCIKEHLEVWQTLPKWQGISYYTPLVSIARQVPLGDDLSVP